LIFLASFACIEKEEETRKKEEKRREENRNQVGTNKQN
jgi:hypothetical protein